MTTTTHPQATRTDAINEMGEREIEYVFDADRWVILTESVFSGVWSMLVVDAWLPLMKTPVVFFDTLEAAEAAAGAVLRGWADSQA